MIEQLSEAFDYNPETHDYRAWQEHHQQLMDAREPAQWPESKFSLSGEKNFNAIFTNAEVKEMREAYAQGDATHEQLASLFGCSVSGMGYILRGDRYPHAGGPLTVHRRISR